MMAHTEPNVGLRIRRLRERQGLSLRALAGRSGLSINAISLIERGENSPTVSSLHLLATALGVPITDFFEAEHEQVTVHVKPEHRLRSYTNGIKMESLGIGLRNQQLEPFLMTVEPGAGDIDMPITHPGEEFVHCLKGEIEYCVGDQRYELEVGDSLLFQATQPHCFHNGSGLPAVFLMVFQAGEHAHLARRRHLVPQPQEPNAVEQEENP
jgi:transcriptional regulator with XRE-family HTH domain